MKTAKKLERHFKGVANHRRIEILLFVRDFEGVTLENMADQLDCNFKTISEHTRRLVQAGLLEKNYRGRFVTHSLSSYGRQFAKFIETFRQS